MSDDLARKYSPGFETEVMVTLTEIKGDLGKLVEAHDATKERVDRHETEISALRALVLKGVGAAVALAVAIPIVLPLLKGA